MDTTEQATRSYSQMTTAPATAIWSLFTAVSDWNKWNTGVQTSSIAGAFAVDSWLTMILLPDHDVIKSKLIKVEVNKLFVDETHLGDIIVKVSHNIDALSNGGSLITYQIEVSGENAEAICAGISSDFPEVLSALVTRAEQS